MCMYVNDWIEWMVAVLLCKGHHDPRQNAENLCYSLEFGLYSNFSEILFRLNWSFSWLLL